MSIRLERINAEYQRAISQIVREQLKDPRIAAMVSITRVDVTNDLMHAKVRVSVYGEEESIRDTLAALKSAAGYISRELGRIVQLRRVPQLHFEQDTSIEYGVRMSKLIDDVVGNTPVESGERGALTPGLGHAND